MRVAAFIPARGGSARIPRKNLQRVGGTTLLERAIWAAFLGGCDPVVSTDDAEIAETARRCCVVDLNPATRVPGSVGTVSRTVEVHDRPAELADAHAQIEAAIHHWWSGLSPDAVPDAVVLLQPTSPFRTAEHVRRALRALEAGYDVAVGVRDVSQVYAFRGRVWSPRDGGPVDGPTYEPMRYRLSRPRSQDIRGSMFAENGALYAWTRAHWERVGDRMWGRAVAPIEMTEVESMDVDTEEDLLIARAVESARR